MAAGSEQKAHHAVKAAKDKLLARRILIQGTGAQHAWRRARERGFFSSRSIRCLTLRAAMPTRLVWVLPSN
jgi:hypothetical protein